MVEKANNLINMECDCDDESRISVEVLASLDRHHDPNDWLAYDNPIYFINFTTAKALKLMLKAIKQ
jgi:hypothetical protein